MYEAAPHDGLIILFPKEMLLYILFPKELKDIIIISKKM